MATEKKGKILIIDDEELILSSLSSILSEGYEVITAEEGISGFSKFRENCPLLILLDVDMPYMDGAEVLARIRQVDRDVPVFMMTGRKAVSGLDPSWTQKCAVLGINGYIMKPVSPDRLLSQIKKAIIASGSGERVASKI